MGYWGWGGYWAPPWFWFSGVSGLVLLSIFGLILIIPIIGIFLSSSSSSSGPTFSLEALPQGLTVFDDGTRDIHFDDYWYRGGLLSKGSTITYNATVISGGTAHFFVSDRGNFVEWWNVGNWQFSQDLGEQLSVGGTFVVPYQDDWFFVAANELNQSNFVRVSYSVTFNQKEAPVRAIMPSWLIPALVLGGVGVIGVAVICVAFIILLRTKSGQGPPGARKPQQESLWSEAESEKASSSRDYESAKPPRAVGTKCWNCAALCEPGEAFCWNCGEKLR
jgi:hypothetical protein